MEPTRAEMLSLIHEMLCDQETLKEPVRNEALCEKARDIIARATLTPEDIRQMAHASQGGCGHCCDDDCRSYGCTYDGAPDGVF